jgi:hypothetical protein
MLENLNFSGTLFVLDGILLSVFCYNRWIESLKDPNNQITYLYRQASLFVSIALVMYGLPSIIDDSQNILSISGSLGMILNAIGFAYFLLIPLYNWLSVQTWTIVKYLIFLSICLQTILLILYPTNTQIDQFGIIHWNFYPLTGLIATVQMDIAFLLNIILLGINFYRLKKLSIFNVVALIATFSFTGFAGGYQYMGNDPLLLAIAGIGLYIGISFVFFSVIHGAINRVLEKA